MKKIITQDGDRRVYIFDDGSEVSFDDINVSTTEPEVVEKKRTRKEKDAE
jgi:hypothetical protein